MGGFFIIQSVQIGRYAWFVFGSLVVLVNSFLHAFRLYLACNQRKPTNVDTDARILCYDIRDLGKQLLPVGMLVVLDSVFNRIIRNRQMGRNTWVYIDEIYLLFQHEYSANFLFTLWKRVRKYGACCTGLTQNVDVRPDRVLCKAA